MGGGEGGVAVKDVLAREARHIGGVSGGMLPQKNYVACAFWSGFGTYDLRAQPTSAHTRNNCACEPERARAFSHPPRRKQ